MIPIPIGYDATVPNGNKGKKMSNGIRIELEQQTLPCGNCEADDEKFSIVITRLGKPADHFCLSCASSLNNKLDRIMREVPTI